MEEIEEMKYAIDYDPFIPMNEELERRALLGMTDFAKILCGGNMKHCTHWIADKDDEHKQGLTVVTGHIIESLSPRTRRVGCRPVIRCTPGVIEQYNFEHSAFGGTRRGPFGEYPRTVITDQNVIDELEKEYQNNTLFETGKVYTIDMIGPFNNEEKFAPRELLEYTYKDYKFVRYVGEIEEDNKREEKVYWVLVEGIYWEGHKYDDYDLLISEEVILGGLALDNKDEYDGDQSKTDLNKYLSEYFIYELMPTEGYLAEKNALYEKDNRKGYNFDYKELNEEEKIKALIESDIPVFLHGKPGDGKSARIKALDPDCQVIYLNQTDEAELTGKTAVINNELVSIKPEWLEKLYSRCATDLNKIHIVFFDEITNAVNSIQSKAFNIVLDKEVSGKWKLPSNARIVAAGNEVADSLSANELSEPLFDRFAHVYINTTVDNWLEWAVNNDIHPSILCYIKYKREQALRTTYNGVTPNANPRKWAMASKLLKETNNPTALTALIGAELTANFINFVSIPVITVEQVLNNEYDESDYSVGMDRKCATIASLVSVDEENFETVRNFVKKMGNEAVAIFDSIWMKNKEERMEIVKNIHAKENAMCKILVRK